MIDKNSEILVYLADEEQELFFNLPSLSSTERRRGASKLASMIPWLGHSVALRSDLKLTEEYLNYVDTLCSHLKGVYPDKRWLKLRFN